MSDDFEFEAPKFIDFQNENEPLQSENEPFPNENDPKLLMQPSPTHIRHTEPSASTLALFNHGASRVAEKVRRRSQQIQAPPEVPLKEKTQKPLVRARSQTPTKKTDPGSSSLALFNHGASRIAEKVRRRSQQIQAPPEVQVPSKEKILRPPVQVRSQTPTKKTDTGSSKMTPLNRGVKPVAEKIRRPSQQIQAPSEVPSKEKILRPQRAAAPFTQTLRSHKPTGTTPLKPLTQPNPIPLRRSSSRCRDAKADMDPRIRQSKIRASVDRLSAPRIQARPEVPSKETILRPPVQARSQTPIKKTEPGSSNLALFNPGASRVAEKVRRRSQQIQAPPEVSSKEKILRPPRAAPFTQTLRSYRPPSGTTPLKPLTQPNPFPFRRSTSRCRDTKADMDPRIRASVDRLSTPRKQRETLRQLK